MLFGLFLLIALTLAIGYRLWQKARRYSGIPGNLGFPIIGNLYQCTKNYWHTWLPSYNIYLEKNMNRFGDICCFWFYHEVNIAISDPHIIEKIVYHPSLADKPYLVFHGVGRFMKNTFSFVSSNKEWKLRRKELNDAFKKSSLDFNHIFIRKAKKAVTLVSDKSGEFDCLAEMILLSVEVIGCTHFGFNLDITQNIDLFKEIHYSSNLVSAILTNPLFGIISFAIPEYFYYPGLQQKFGDTICENVMSKAATGGTDEEIKKLPVASVIALRHKSRKTSKWELRKELTELLYVGSHTVGIATASALVFLATHPNVQEKVWQEQQEIFSDSTRDPTCDDLRRMKYLERFYKEVLRFVAPSIVIKTAKCDIDIGGMTIPEGALVTINSRRMRSDSRYWENPEKFDPDRFSDEKILKIPKIACAFFGFGIRSCPGAHYANYNVKVILSALVRNFKIRSTIDFDEIKYNAFIMMEMKGGYKISVEKRKSQLVHRSSVPIAQTSNHA